MKRIGNIRKEGLVASGAILLIIIISSVFSYPIRIVDALTLQTATGFDVHIPVLRILFEPFLGPVLFFIRRFYPVDEVMQLLWLVLLLYVVYSVVQLILIKNRRDNYRFLLSQAVNLPFVIGLWFTFLLIIVFVSVRLPNNTIENNTRDKVLVTTHSHSEFSHDGLISQTDLWEWHKYNNFDAFFITDHNTHKKTLEFAQKQRAGNFPSEPLVMCGEEFSGSNHLSLLGLKRDFKTRGYTDEQAIDSARASGGAVIVNHWFDGEHKTPDYYKNLGVDGFEIENTATEITYNRDVYKRIKSFCAANNLIMNGGLDFHGYLNVCSLWNAMEIPGWNKLSQTEKESAILDIIKSRDQSKLEVLLYSDRPYYTRKHLFLMPVVHLFNYFRTLNFAQVLSWVVWIAIFAFAKITLSENKKLNEKFTANNLVAIIGLIGAVGILLVGADYFLRISRVAGSDNDIYIEYSHLLFYVGGALFIYSGIVVFFRMIKKHSKK
jgi:hypothetical protein